MSIPRFSEHLLHEAMSVESRRVKECIEHIRALLSSPDFADGCTTSLELCELLSDGEILCSVLAELSQGQDLAEVAYTSYYMRNSQLLARRNIRNFLRQCWTAFGTSEKELFEVDDLVEMNDPDRVVWVLHGLLQRRSKAAQSRDSGILANVVQEICDHERQLTEKLLKVLLFRKELLGILSEWDEELVAVVFRYTDQLYLLHKQLHSKLTALASKGCEHFCQNISSVFAGMLPRIEIYFQYFSHLPTANARLKAELERFPEKNDQLEMLEKLICDPNTFNYVYDAPIRQLPNYQQLFIRLEKTAKKEAPETLPSVSKALSDLKSLLTRADVYQSEAQQTDDTIVVLSEVTGLKAELRQPSEIGLLQADASFRVRYRPRAARGSARRSESCATAFSQPSISL
ncbi:hypothetical protein BOX15_Mlig030523g2 [Macrostomum lignano]|uniref:DH domain-containing protein n=1 Tax=Macrostomum lignano TaxID=282301 RepID=A0A267FYV3_9PLAT|nr:hypothetical protein BOX15_Mlig030523g2 [Macrostomum lignano]